MNAAHKAGAYEADPHSQPPLVVFKARIPDLAG